MKNDMIEKVLADKSASEWLKSALRSAVDRDPVDLANDLEVLCRCIDYRSDAHHRAIRERDCFLSVLTALVECDERSGPTWDHARGVLMDLDVEVGHE